MSRASQVCEFLNEFGAELRVGQSSTGVSSVRLGPAFADVGFLPLPYLASTIMTTKKRRKQLMVDTNRLQPLRRVGGEAVRARRSRSRGEMVNAI